MFAVSSKSNELLDTFTASFQPDMDKLELMTENLKDVREEINISLKAEKQVTILYEEQFNE